MSEHILFWKYFEEWVEVYKEGDVKPVTLRTYTTAVKWVKRLAPDLYLDTMTRMQYQSLIKKYGEKHEIATTRNFLHSCNSPIGDALYEGIVGRDPRYKVHATSSKKHKVTRNKYLEADEAERLERVLKEDGSALAVMADFILRTGLRYGEVLGLTPNDVDFDAMTIDINKTYNYKVEHPTEWRPTKNKSSMRIIAIDEQAKRDLQHYIDSTDKDKSIFVTAINNEAPKGMNMPVANVRVNRWLTRMCDKANVPRITIHNLRHTHASLLITNDVSIQSIAKRLGHASTETTQKYYLHLLNKKKEEDDKKMKDILANLN